jgi:catechol 2,3-dioxygenase-like lactoylglutathione lyase family enzyme
MFQKAWLDHVVLRVKNVNQVSKFYQDVLDASVERELDIGLRQLRVGSLLIDLIALDSELGRKGGLAPTGGKNLDHFCIRVEPFDRKAIKKRLDKFGVVCSDVRELYGADGYGPSVYFHDPEGNMIEIKGSPVSKLEGKD